MKIKNARIYKARPLLIFIVECFNKFKDFSSKIKYGVKMKGKVKFFNEMKGFGFIAGEDGKEYFVHQTGLTEGTEIGENDSVTFEVEQGDRGQKAVKVALAKE